MNKITIWFNKRFYDFKDWVFSRYMKHKYSDWEDNEYNCGDIKFIWGIKSYDCLVSGPANICTMNDIDITYSRKTGLYSLGLETAYLFEEGKIGEVKYLDNLLNEFTKFMNENGYNTNEPYTFFLCSPIVEYFAKTIPELYTQFRIFVEGYRAVYGKECEQE